MRHHIACSGRHPSGARRTFRVALIEAYPLIQGGTRYVMPRPAFCFLPHFSAIAEDARSYSYVTVEWIWMSVCVNHGWLAKG